MLQIMMDAERTAAQVRLVGFIVSAQSCVRWIVGGVVRGDFAMSGLPPKPANAVFEVHVNGEAPTRAKGRKF